MDSACIADTADREIIVWLLRGFQLEGASTHAGRDRVSEASAPVKDPSAGKSLQRQYSYTTLTVIQITLLTGNLNYPYPKTRLTAYSTRPDFIKKSK